MLIRATSYLPSPKWLRRPSRRASPPSLKLRRASKLKVNRGFTLIELIAVIAVTSFISVLIVANHARFENSVLVTDLAYDIALAVREAQIYGISVRQETVGSGEFRLRYGVHFVSDSPTSFILFSDRGGLFNEGNGVYDPTDGDRIVKTFNVQQGHRISEFCVTDSAMTEVCSPAMTTLDITFMRPDLDANIAGDGISGFSSGSVAVMSPGGLGREVFVTNTGQISVQ